MKKVIVPLLFLIILLLALMFIYRNVVDKAKALDIGEEKYLEFLWIVDGAFSNSEYTVNNKTLTNDKKIFKCLDKNNKTNECIGNNFEKEFYKLFSENIKYDNVYSDGLIYKWYRYDNGKYYFKYFDNCDKNHMNPNHQLELVSISNDILKYQVSFLNNQTKRIIKRDFVLVLEDNNWKIKNAFYYDTCDIKYYIY